VEAGLQRLFSTFASGWPGAGLVLLRLATAASLFYCAITQWEVTPQLLSMIPQLAGAGAGTFLLVGLWTPLAGGIVAVVELWIAFLRGGGPPVILFAALGASLAMIGPGAWSVDARLFGRKHIEMSSR
jgi:putative oxidoreductase